MSALVDLVRIAVSSTGTSTLTLGSAISGYRGVEALVANREYDYSIGNIGAGFEFGRGTFLTGPARLTRGVVGSSNGNAAVDLVQGAIVTFTALAETLDATGVAGNATLASASAASAQSAASAASASATGANVARSAAEDARDMAKHYANDATNTDIPGGVSGERGARYWANVASATGAKSSILLTTTSTGNAINLSAVTSPSGIPADLLNVEYFFIAAGDKPVGSPSFNVAGLGALSVTDRDGVSGLTAANVWKAGDRVSFVRQGASDPSPFVLRLTSVTRGTATDADFDALSPFRAATPEKIVPRIAAARAGAVQDVARPLWSFDWELPSSARPVRMQLVQPWRLVVDIVPPADAYRDGYLARRMPDDLMRVELINLTGRYLTGATYPDIWGMTSIWSRFEGHWSALAAFSWNDILGSATGNGLAPSQFDPVIYVDKMANVGPSFNTQGSGPYHGNLDGTSFQPVSVNASQGAALIADGTNIRSLFSLTEPIFAQSISLNFGWRYKTPDGTRASDLSGTYNFDPSSGHAMRVFTDNQFVSSPAVGVSQGYAQMLPTRGLDKASVRYLSGALSPEFTFPVPTADGDFTDLGQAQRIMAWHSARPGHCVQMEVNSAYCPFRRNDVAVSYPGLEAFALNNRRSYGVKFYMPSHVNSSTVDNESGNKLSTLVYYDAVRANSA